MAETHLSHLFAALAAANEFPTPETITLYTDGMLRDRIAEAWRGMELPEEPLAAFCAALEPYVGADPTETLDELRREYTRLFLTPDRLLYNCQGPWTSKKQGRANILFMVNEHSTKISDFMHSCGVVKSAGYNDSMDLVENEWWFCSMLAEQPEYLTAKGVDPLSRLDEFIDTYLKAWLPQFADDVAAVTRVPYFAALARIQADFLELY
ncbi:MAG: molecular chaperone TorD family protein [Eggerthellaceae bacterium]|nr:molecular chaperone TorD family protein [Eggerthellaceae bacterium]